MAIAISVAVALLSDRSSPDPDSGLSRPSGPVDPLLELQATLPTGGVAVLNRCGRVRETDDRE